MKEGQTIKWPSTICWCICNLHLAWWSRMLCWTLDGFQGEAMVVEEGGGGGQWACESWDTKCMFVSTLNGHPTQNSFCGVLKIKWTTWHEWIIRIQGVADPRVLGSLWQKWVFCNWHCNSIFELHWTLATYYIYNVTHCNSIVTQSKQHISTTMQFHYNCTHDVMLISLIVIHSLKFDIWHYEKFGHKIISFLKYWFPSSIMIVNDGSRLWHVAK